MISRFKYRNGAASWRVGGRPYGARIRKSFKTREEVAAEKAAQPRVVGHGARENPRHAVHRRLRPDGGNARADAQIEKQRAARERENAMTASALKTTVAALRVAGKGILAADESTPTI